MEQPVLIDENNLSTGIVVRENKRINTSYFWHKIIVQNTTGYTREFVLRTLMNAVHPCDFIPVSYAIEDDKATFLLKNCGPAIYEFCRMNLIVPHPEANKCLPPFKLSIIVRYALASDQKVEIQSNILQVLKKRYNATTKTLNLDYFYKDEDVNEFCPLSQHKLLYFVLHLSRENEIENLKLGGNEIAVIKPLEVLYNEKFRRRLVSIDLRKNNIADEDQLNVLRSFAITELNLDENPVCSKYELKHEYVKMIRQFCPKITTLDGCKVQSEGTPTFRRNFMCAPHAQDLIDQFLEHYFTLYDSSSRNLLESIYHKEAMFSMTTQHMPNQESSFTTKLPLYKRVSRNVKLISDLSKSTEYLYVGPANIIKVLSGLPACQHDPHTFTVDLSYFMEKTSIITITGFFKEPGQHLLDNDCLYGFTRTFVLILGANQEYNICNDQLHVFNATNSNAKKAFQITQMPRSNYIHVQPAKNKSEKDEMVSALAALTCLKTDWARKCLEESQYDLKKALIIFIDLFKGEKLPAHAFSSTEELPIRTVTTKAAPKPMETSVPNPYGMPYNQIPPSVPIVPPPAPMVSPNVMNAVGMQKQPTPPSFPAAVVPKTAPVLTKVQTLTRVPVQPVPPVAAPAVAPVPKPTVPADASKAKTNEAVAVAIPENSPVKTDSSSKITSPPNVKDPILLEAFELSENAPRAEAKQKLEAAAEKTLKTYTYAVRYYRGLGKLFYKFKLLDEARMFLKDAMKALSKILGEEIYSVFTLYEIQMGELSEAEKMLCHTAQTYPVAKTVKLINEHVTKVNVDFVSKMFPKILDLNLPAEKKSALQCAYDDFKKKHVKLSPVKKPQQPKPVGKPQQPKPVGKPQQPKPVEKPPVEKPKQSAPVEKPQQPTPVEKPQPPPKDKINVIQDIVIPSGKESSHDKIWTNDSFLTFRTALLKKTDIVNVEDVNDPEVTTFADKPSQPYLLIKKADELLEKHKGNFTVVRTLCCKLWSRHLMKKVRKILAASKFFVDNKLLNNLIILFKIRLDMNTNNVTAVMEKMQSHIRVCDYRQMSCFLEDLIHEKSAPHISIFEGCLKNSIPKPKLTLLSLFYKTHALLSGNVDITEQVNAHMAKHTQASFHFHPDDIYSTELETILLRMYTKKSSELAKVFNEVTKYIDQQNTSLKALIDGTIVLYKWGMPTYARQVKNNTVKAGKRDDIMLFKYFVTVALMEFRYGEPNVGKKILENASSLVVSKEFDVSTNVSYVGPLMEYYIVTMKFDEVKKLFELQMKDKFKILDPDYQRIFYMYHTYWTETYKFNLFNDKAMS